MKKGLCILALMLLSLPIFGQSQSVTCEAESCTYRRPLFALKTNLLFDVATLANIEIETPLAKRWSIAGEWIFPWWLWENQQNCMAQATKSVDALPLTQPINLKSVQYDKLCAQSIIFAL